MLDPTKRTVKGVSEIIQREWIVNCHPFSTRYGYMCTLFELSTSKHLKVFLLSFSYYKLQLVSMNC